MTHNESNQVNLVSRASPPTAARRWLDRALPQDLDLPSSIQIEQEGTMEIRGRWTRFKASEVYKVSPLSFNWRARFRMLPGVWIVAEDGHLDGQGWGSARLWGMVPMGKRTDPEVLTSQLVRNLGELAWLPSFVLSDSTLTWSEAGETVFEVRSSAGDQEVMVRFEIDDQGDVIQAYSPSRPYDVPGGYAEAPWYYEFSDQCEFGEVRIPAAAFAMFEKSDAPWEYFRGRITSVTLGTTCPRASERAVWLGY
ncbi:MAG: DUF6544 family protein [Dehalococcoidia bacterium]